jgi:hypothetical protein
MKRRLGARVSKASGRPAASSDRVPRTAAANRHSGVVGTGRQVGLVLDAARLFRQLS